MSDNPQTRDSIDPFAGAPRAELVDDFEDDGDGQRGLALVVAGLKEQLRQLIQANQGMEAKLSLARRQVNEERQQREELQSRLDKLERARAHHEDLEADVERLRRERDALAGQVIDLEQDLAASEQRVDEIGELLDLFRAERDEASDEVACLDSQFARAISVIGELRAALAASRQREEDLSARLARLDEQLELVTEERDLIERDLSESQSSLESVRQSLLAVSGEWRSLFER